MFYYNVVIVFFLFPIVEICYCQKVVLFME